MRTPSVSIGVVPGLTKLWFYQVLARIPLSLLYGLSSALYGIVYYVARYRRRTVADNLAHAFPALEASERRQLEQSFYRHICDLLVEVFSARYMQPDQLAHHVQLENPEILQPFIEQKQSLLLLSIHQGNWEWLLRRVGDYLPCPMDGIYKPLHNAAMDQFIQESRATSINPIPFQNAGREMLRKRREFRAFAMLADQAPFKRDPRYWHLFLNRTASFYLGPQKLAEVTQYPVIFVAMKKLGRGRYSAHFEILATPPHAREGFQILDRYIDACERAIRAQPETWLWSNRKWKHNPPTAAVSAIPAEDDAHKPVATDATEQLR